MNHRLARFDMVLLLVALLGIALLVGAWFALRRVAKKMDGMRPGVEDQRSP